MKTKELSYDIYSAAPLKLRKAEKFFRDDLLQFAPPLFPINYKEEERADYRQLTHVNFPDLSLQLLLAGRFKVSWEGGEAVMQPGDLLIEPIGSSLTIGNPPDCSSHRLIVSFKGTLLYPFAASLGLDTTAVLSLKDPERIRKQMLIIRDILSGDCHTLLPELMGAGVTLMATAAEERKTLERWLPEKIACSYSFILCHLADDISADDVQSYSCYELPVLNREFKKYFGLTVGELIRKERLLRAEKLLVSTDRTVKEIARQCGFRNGKYFSDAFKKTHDLSPKEFREKERKS